MSTQIIKHPILGEIEVEFEVDELLPEHKPTFDIERVSIRTEFVTLEAEIITEYVSIPTEALKEEVLQEIEDIIKRGEE